MTSGGEIKNKLLVESNETISIWGNKIRLIIYPRPDFQAGFPSNNTQR